MLTKSEVMKAVNKKRTEKIIPIEPVKTPDGKGGYKTVWTPRIPLMAKVRKQSYKTDIAAGTVSSELLRELEVLYRADIIKGWKVECGDKKYSVDNVYSYDAATTILVCREVVK